MWRMLIVLFLLAHGAIHAAVWATPRTGAAPFDPSHSWLLGSLGLGDAAARPLSIALALVGMLGFMGAGIGLYAQQEWWRALAVSAAAISLVLIALYFNAWLSGAALLNAGIVLALAWAHWPSAETIGA